MKKSNLLFIVIIVVLFQFKSFNTIDQDLCIYTLGGNIEDCNATIEKIDSFNNYQLHPRLNEILKRDYFRYFRVNLYKICQFWPDDARCSIKDCLVKTCSDDDLPFALQKYLKNNQNIHESTDDQDPNSNCEQLNPLGHLNDTITEDNLKVFEDWKRYDDSSDNFCEPDDEYMEKARYVDLFVNPERYTGYQGPHAHKIWNSIYQENCFKESVQNQFSYGALTPSVETCFEKRVFYRLVSGLHTSINVHLCANYLHKGLLKEADYWGPSREQFKKRFNVKATNGQGTQWLKNLYFTYLIELRAIAKAAPYLEREDYYTGNTVEDEETKTSIKDLLRTIRSFEYHFDETSMFKGDEREMAKLKEEFQIKFRNVTKIMDCVGCDKCRLWGKLQTQALGTALKILFSPKKLGLGTTRRTFQLSRSEIVSLINGFGRLSTSVTELENFKELFETK